MKKFWYVGVILIPLIVLVLFMGCATEGGSGTGSFTYDGQTYPLTGAGLDIFTEYFEVNLVSSGINVAEWTGTGNIVWFDLTSPSTQGAPGTYDWAVTGGYELYDAAISLNYVAGSGTGTWLSADDVLASTADYVSIAVDGSTYTIEFHLTMTDGKTVTGSYTGTVTIW